MAQAAQIIFSHKEVVEALVKQQGIHEGIWGLWVKFGIQGANIAFGSPNLVPAAIVPVIEIGLQKFDEVNNLSVDAAIVNPAPARQAEFEKFAREVGHNVENGIVSFEQDGEAAREFHTEASKAGFDVVIDYNRAGSYKGTDDLSKLPKYWYVRLAP